MKKEYKKPILKAKKMNNLFLKKERFVNGFDFLYFDNEKILLSQASCSCACTGGREDDG